MFEGREPGLFFSIFKSLIIFKVPWYTHTCIHFCSAFQVPCKEWSGCIAWILIFEFVISFPFQGGRSAAYRNHVLQKSDRNGSHQRDGVALFRVQGLKHDCMQAIQVDLVSSAKNKEPAHN